MAIFKKFIFIPLTKNNNKTLQQSHLFFLCRRLRWWLLLWLCESVSLFWCFVARLLFMTEACCTALPPVSSACLRCTSCHWWLESTRTSTEPADFRWPEKLRVLLLSLSEPESFRRCFDRCRRCFRCELCEPRDNSLSLSDVLRPLCLCLHVDLLMSLCVCVKIILPILFARPRVVWWLTFHRTWTKAMWRNIGTVFSCCGWSNRSRTSGYTEQPFLLWPCPRRTFDATRWIGRSIRIIVIVIGRLMSYW